jgi:putative ABC transport system ATP-binding protein
MEHTPHNETLVRLEGAAKSYTMGKIVVPALKPTTFSVLQGDLLVVLGPSGSGKTTLLNLIGGIDTPTDGHIFFKEKDLACMNDTELTQYRRYSVGFVFQFFNLVPTLTALENVQLVAELVPNPLNAQDMLDSVGLGDKLNRFPSELSGGEQQRVAIARALVKRPELILADEPTGNLDFETGIRVLKILHDQAVTSGIAVLMVTHNTPIASIAHRIIHMRSGEIVSLAANPNPLDPEEVQW